MTNEQRIDWIERYFSGGLDPQAQQDFQNLLKQDTLLAQEFKFHKLANAILIDDMLIKEKHKLATQIDYAKLNRKMWFKSNKWYIIIAGTLLITTSVMLIPNKAKSILPPSIIAVADTVTQSIVPEQNQSFKQEKIMTPTEKSPQDLPKAVTLQKTTQDVKDDSLITSDQSLAKTSATILDSVETTIQDNKSDVKADLYQDTVQAKQSDIKDYNLTLSLDPKPIASLKDTVKPCAELSAELKIVSTCTAQANGEIHVLDKNENYTYTIDGNESTDFFNLSQGNYLLDIEDQNGCMTQKEVFVDQKQCVSHDYIFNKAFQEKVSFHLKEESGTIRIIHVKTGREVIQFSFDYGKPSYWDGQDSQDMFVQTGLYIVLINYQSGESIKGTLTISE